ncbi:MAG: HAMP domain-containing histidine kinase [Lachnospiraceae bacterium]|nr:HAMP domain-containing histidine kinase [Lachnospiraceae bacterium]
MNKVRKKFVLYAMIAIFVLISVLLAVINGINFTMASEDADQITQRIADAHGVLKKNNPKETVESSTRRGPMGPDSPEMHSSIRYFTVSFNKEDGKEKLVEYQISAVSEKEAIKWAKELKNESTGWTKMTYRYRVYKHDGKIYVTVIDQGRELLSAYRILIISACGELIVLILSFILLRMVGKKLFKPLEEADRKQKKFIANVENDFKMPLTIINANTEIIEKENGPSEYTKSINRQVKKMTKLVKNLGSLSIFNEKNMTVSEVNLSNLFNYAIDYYKKKFKDKNIAIEFEIEPDIILNGDEAAIKNVLNELIDNSLKFAISNVTFSLDQKNDRVTIRQMNDTNLLNGSVDQVFDRFSTLENAKEKEGVGLGLSYVKDIIKAHNGRVSARVNNGSFILQIDL